LTSDCNTLGTKCSAKIKWEQRNPVSGCWVAMFWLLSLIDRFWHSLYGLER